MKGVDGCKLFHQKKALNHLQAVSRTFFVSYVGLFSTENLKQVLYGGS
jgi:hypothetical protein